METRIIPPGEYFYEDLEVGDSFRTGSLVVSESQIVAFAGLSGDFFDLHMDDAFARSQGFAGRVAHGLLGLALADGLKNRASVRIMGIASLGWNWAFKGPLLAGDRMTVTVTVMAKRLTSREKRGLVTLRFVVTKDDSSVVQEGETFLLTRKRVDEEPACA